jgi:putative FmdB family regulatory protein
MPIYEYQCEKCGHQFEYLVLHSSPAPECPSCHHTELQKMISLCAVSSEGTRQTHLKRERKKYKKINHDKQYEEHKAIHEHHD